MRGGHYGRLARTGCGVAAGGLLWEVDFSTMTLGALASMVAGLSFSRASVATVQTSASAVDATPTANVARIGNDGSGQGLVFEEARTNDVVNSSTDGYSASNVTITTTTGPSGETTGRINDASGAAIGNASKIHTLTASVAYCGSAWIREVSGSGSLQFNWNNLTGGTSFAFARPLAEGSNVWCRRLKTGATSSGTPTGSVAVLPASTSSASTGVIDAAFVQCERGSFCTEAIVTAGAAATRAGERLFHSTPATILHSGRLGLELKLRPKGSISSYTTNPRIWTQGSDYAEVDKTTRALSVSIGGVVRTLGTALPTWSAGDVLEVWIEAGGGVAVTNGAARVNGGATTQLGTGAAQAALSVSTAVDLLCSTTTAQFSAWVQRLRAYRLGRKPSWA